MTKITNTYVLDKAKISVLLLIMLFTCPLAFAQSEPESDYTLPTAWIDFEAKGANEAEKGNYSLMVLEDSEQVVYALLYKQAD